MKLYANKRAWVMTLAAAGVICLTACNQQKQDQAKTLTPQSTEEHRSAYAIGASVGTYIANMKKNQAEYIGDIDDEYIIQGFTDALASKSQIDEKEIESTLRGLDERAQNKMLETAKVQAQTNLEEGKKFLEENAKKDGVKTTDSGLQYKVNSEGQGNKPVIDDTISVKYKGTTLDGKVFDEQSEPVDFPLNNQMIKGWVEGVQLMSKGAKYTLYIPSHLAYGEDGAGDRIKPNSVLIFDVELVDIKK